jgi:hypothetical protein
VTGLVVMGGRSLVGRQDWIFDGKHHGFNSYLAAENARRGFGFVHQF